MQLAPRAGRHAGPLQRSVVRGSGAVALVLAAVAASQVGCSAVRRTPRVVAPSELPSAAALTARLTERQGALRALRSIARLRLREGDETTTTRQVLLVSRPDRFRIEVMSILGTVFIMTADEQSFRAYTPGEKSFIRGTPDRNVLARYARIDLDVRELIDLLLASPVLPSSDDAVASFDEATGWTGLTIRADAGERVYWFAGDGPLVAITAVDSDGDIEWQAQFDEYQVLDGIALAHRIEVDFPGRQRHMAIRLQDPEVNPSMDASLFTLKAVDGVPVVDLDPEAR